MVYSASHYVFLLWRGPGSPHRGLSPCQGVSRKKRGENTFWGGLSRCGTTDMKLLLLPPSLLTQEIFSLAAEQANELLVSINTDSFHWKEMTHVRNHAPPQSLVGQSPWWTDSRILWQTAVSIVCIPGLKRDVSDVLSMPVLNFGRPVLFQGYLNRTKFHFSSISKYKLLPEFSFHAVFPCDLFSCFNW